MSREKVRSGGRLIILSAPSGCGKTTLVEKLFKRRHALKRSVSVTTRKPRPGERSGRDYVFVTRAEFLRRRRQNQFLEWAKVHGELYGTSAPAVWRLVRRGLDILLTIDVQGMRQLKRAAMQKAKLVTIFLMPPSLAILRTRLMGRGTETKAAVEKRLQVAKKEIAACVEYDHVLVNRQVDQTVKRFERILYGKQKK